MVLWNNKLQPLHWLSAVSWSCSLLVWRWAVAWQLLHEAEVRHVLLAEAWLCVCPPAESHPINLLQCAVRLCTMLHTHFISAVHQVRSVYSQINEKTTYVFVFYDAPPNVMLTTRCYCYAYVEVYFLNKILRHFITRLLVCVKICTNYYFLQWSMVYSLLSTRAARFKNYNHFFFFQYWDHDGLTRLLIDFWIYWKKIVFESGFS